MCGRTCLTLSPHDIQTACTYKSLPTDKYTKPEFRPEYNCGKTYQPSYNIAPTDVTPVLVSAAHFDDEHSSTERCLVPMMWSLIPFWHKGDYRKHGLTTNNCRLETLEQSKLYKNSLHKGQRCVILCEGFYEWQTTNKKATKSSERDAYFIYMPQNKSIQIADKTTWEADDINLLKIAGLFDMWTNENGDTIYSYTVITFESNDHLSWLHERSPAILETDQQVSDWLDYKNVPQKNAIQVLKPAKLIEWHRVSKLVNNSRNKTSECNKPIENTKAGKSQNFMDLWLNSQKK